MDTKSLYTCIDPITQMTTAVSTRAKLAKRQSPKRRLTEDRSTTKITLQKNLFEALTPKLN